MFIINLFNFQVKDSKNNPITGISAFAQSFVSSLHAGIIEAKKLVVNGVDVLEKINGLSSKMDAQQNVIDKQAREIEALKQEIQNLKQKISN